jgi:carbonic anhydrase/acetyltransferase-like protein (isoleucine patch superfamily)
MALVTPGMKVPAGKLVMGQPARVVRDVSEAERAWMRETVENYANLAKDYSRSAP